MPAIPARVIATCFALVSFTAAVVVGLMAGNTTGRVLVSAIVVMLVCWGVGRLVGEVAIRAIDHRIARYKADHPLPDAGVAAQAEGQADALPATDRVAASV